MERQSTNRNKHRGDELEDIQRESQENRENRTQQGKQKQNNRKRKSKDQEGSLKTGASPSVCRFVQSLCETRHQGFLPESVSEDLSTTQIIKALSEEIRGKYLHGLAKEKLGNRKLNHLISTKILCKNQWI
uniref:Uncharacterized protein n=1 Tax=Populus trichocarpa TaxID=3694 RepID=A0A3N7FXE7_POPTR|eukprot:XP_024441282.1 uncharacterized protein LOC18104929 isoform X1 [Populus trichocarpa]